jgi:ADP-dependent NAD(P)H-hydrate dehydratase / NAD(P)H-hydrate epimerase
LPLPDRMGEWRPRAANDLLEYLWDTPYDALLVGCGLGRADSTLEFLLRLLENLHTLENVPALVLDADALNLLAGRPEWWTHLTLPLPPIFTPHPGEMARLLGSSTAEVQQDRRAAAREAARRWNVIAVLKGAYTLIAAPNGELTLIPFANPALATAGTGDVLAGTIAGLAAQFRAASEHGTETDPIRQAYNAAVTGAYVHAVAGELAAANSGDAGLVAGDLLPRLPEGMKRIKGHLP